MHKQIKQQVRAAALLWQVWPVSRRKSAAPWVAVLGLDGSGKSSVLSKLEREFRPPDITGIKIVYRRPEVSNRPAQRGGPVVDHYAKPPHRLAPSLLKLGVRAVDWWLGYWSRLAWQRAKGYLVLSDRHYFLDMAVDPLRYRYAGPASLPALAARILPRPTLFILLDAPVSVLQGRKQEVSPAEGVRQRAAYLELVQKLPNSHTVDASRPLEQVVAEVERIILKAINAQASREEYG